MTLRQLVERLEYIGRNVSNADIPVRVNNNNVDLIINLDNTFDKESDNSAGLCVNIKFEKL